jgi:MFS family permease
MTDDFVASLRNDWREQDLELEQVRRRLARARLATRALIVVEAAYTAIGVAVGVWFAVMAWKHSDVFFGISAFTLLLAVPPAYILLLRARRQSLDVSGETPEETVRSALKRTIAADRIVRIGFWNAAALMLFVVVLWVCVAAGVIPHQYPVVLFSAIWLASAAIVSLWYLWRRKRNAAERRQCERLLAQYEAM